MVNQPLEQKNNKETSSVFISKQEVRGTWYDDRLSNVLFQRNILIIISLLCLVCLSVATYIVGHVATSKSFAPFVIRIDEITGNTQVVNPSTLKIIGGNEAIARYFIKKYIVARESYNPVDFKYNLQTVVRLLSTQRVYKQFTSYIRNPDNDPSARYGQKNVTYIKVKSISKLENKYFVRFALHEVQEDQKIYDKIATLSIDYLPMELSDQDKDVNPIGFQVTDYRVDDDMA
ncbi:MAG: VirB8/TrbF family protein [Rickettsiaceae bacterium]|nr:VirB8/TrbF family protein [Rickettsiaceae bacterium]